YHDCATWVKMISNILIIFGVTLICFPSKESSCDPSFHINPKKDLRDEEVVVDSIIVNWFQSGFSSRTTSMMIISINAGVYLLKTIFP
ncbi:hypothetical protein P6709_20045, partial [Jeotgalibacillus sp. ET6]|uniref:hypothetical protein n=1 Tax=Jeotgalibacillus sp. ET6 TaxID=3037260 RepID=UPI0024189228